MKKGHFFRPSGHFSRVLRAQVGQDFSRLVCSLPTRVESSSLRALWAMPEPKTLTPKNHENWLDFNETVNKQLTQGKRSFYAAMLFLMIFEV